MREGTSHRVRDILHQVIRDLVDQGMDTLPSEHVLCVQLGVSRPTLRNALVMLEKEGLIVRVHGKGTIINTWATRIKANLNTDWIYGDVIRQHGYQCRMQILDHEVRESDPIASRQLERPDGPYLIVRRLFLADGHPVILSTDSVPLDLLRCSVQTVHFEENLLRFAENWCLQRIEYSIAHITTAMSDGDVTVIFRLPSPQPLLYFRHLHIGLQNRPIMMNQAVIHPAYIELGMVRNWPHRDNKLDEPVALSKLAQSVEKASDERRRIMRGRTYYQGG